MDGRVDYKNYTYAELLEALDSIDQNRYPENFRRLVAALNAHRAVTATPEAPGPALPQPKPRPPRPPAGPLVSEAEPVAVRLNPARGPFGRIAPARNGFHLVGSGSVWVGQDSIRIAARTLAVLLGYPFRRHIELDRRYIVNVEILSNAVRLEYRPLDSADRALTLWLNDADAATKLAEALPGERTEDFQPHLPSEIDFEERLQARSRYAPVTTALVTSNVLVFLAGAFSGELSVFLPAGNAYVAWGSNFGPYTTAGEWWRLFTSMFLHLGVLHLAFNMWALASFGPLTERLLGSVSYALVYVLAGLAASCTSIAFQPAVNSLGASGAIFGILGALMAVLIDNQTISRTLLKALRNSTAIFVVCALSLGMGSLGVDNAAHVGGLLCGFILGLAHSISHDMKRRELRDVVAAIAIAIAGVSFAAGGSALALRRSALLEGDNLYLHTRQWYIHTERVVAARESMLWKQARTSQIGDAAFAVSVEGHILPVWKEAEQRLQAVELPPMSSFSADLKFLREYTRIRRAAYELCVVGARSGNSDTVSRCVAELNRSNSLAEDRRAKKTSSRS